MSIKTTQFKKIRNLALISIGALGVTQAPLASAYDFDNLGPYVGGNYGSLSVDNSDFDEDDNAYSFTLGANVLPAVGIQASYHDFGDYSGVASAVETTGYSLAAVGNLPITDTFGLYAKAGQLWWDSEYSILGADGDYSDNDFFYGVGAKLQLIENLDLLVSYDRYKIDLNSDASLDDSGDYDADVNFASLGVNYAF